MEFPINGETYVVNDAQDNLLYKDPVRDHVYLEDQFIKATHVHVGR